MSSVIYSRAAEDGLRQCSIITDIFQWVQEVDGTTSPDDKPKFTREDHAFVIVCSQDCDLVQDFADHQSVSSDVDQKTDRMPSILLCSAYSSKEVRHRSELNSSLWAAIKKNRDPRFHFLEKVPSECDVSGEGLPELTLDFRNHFSLPPGNIYWQLRHKAKVRTVLISPYLEHLSQRFCAFHSRVALPTQHVSDPV